LSIQDGRPNERATSGEDPRKKRKSPVVEEAKTSVSGGGKSRTTKTLGFGDSVGRKRMKGGGKHPRATHEGALPKERRGRGLVNGID